MIVCRSKAEIEKLRRVHPLRSRRLRPLPRAAGRCRPVQSLCECGL